LETYLNIRTVRLEGSENKNRDFLHLATFDVEFLCQIEAVPGDCHPLR